MIISPLIFLQQNAELVIEIFTCGVNRSVDQTFPADRFRCERGRFQCSHPAFLLLSLWLPLCYSLLFKNTLRLMQHNFSLCLLGKFGSTHLIFERAYQKCTKCVSRSVCRRLFLPAFPLTGLQWRMHLPGKQSKLNSMKICMGFSSAHNEVHWSFASDIKGSRI